MIFLRLTSLRVGFAPSSVRWLLPLAALLIVAIAGACGGGDGSSGGGDEGDGEGGFGPTEPAGGGDGAPQLNPDAESVQIVFTSRDFAVGPASNVGFALQGEDGMLLVADSLTVTFFDLRDGEQVAAIQVEAVASAPGVGEEFEHVHTDGSEHVHGGESDRRVTYYARAEFEYAGSWGLLAQGTLEDGTEVEGSVLFQVFEEPLILAPGDEAPRTENLTRFDVEDIRTIDSGTVPNDMHDITIKDALEAGRPLVIVFSTPAFCQTRFCGPVTQEVESLHDEYAESVDFVHIEIYTDFANQELNGAVEEWLFQEDGGFTEPWVFVVDHEGVIYDRWENAVARSVLEPAVQAVAGGATYAELIAAAP